MTGKRTTPVETLSDDRSSSSTEEVLDIQGDQFNENKEEVSKLNLNCYDMWALGLTTAIGGHYFSWNEGLRIGFGGFLIALFLISTAYFCLILCIAELSSALPFAGGAYGIARVTLGIFPGYLVSICDSYKSVIYVSLAVFSAGQILTRIFQSNQDVEFLYWTVLFLCYLSVLTYGGRFFWQINFGLAALSLMILVMYIFGATPFVEFEKNAAFPDETGVDRWFQGGIYDFLSVLPTASRFFRGIQSINLACGQIKNPKTEVPKGYLGAMCTVMCTAFAVLFLAAAVKPGILEFIVRARPLTNGFAQMFGVSRHRAAILSLPATVMSGFGFMYYYGQQFSAMGNSGLLNPCFGWEFPGRSTPVVALVVGTAVAYMLCVIQWYYPRTENQIYALSILGSSATYISIFASYIMFRNYYPTIKREFVSPLGTFGAVYGALVFSLCFISICGFQEDQVAIIVFGIVMVVASIYYYFVVRTRQTFSKEEKTVMFKAYLLKNNAAKAVRIRRGQAGAHAMGGPAISTASAGSSSGTNASSAAGLCAGSRSKNSSRQVARISVEPLPQNDEAPKHGQNGEGSATPTSTTVAIPYRAPEPAEQTSDRTPRSRRTSENNIEVPLSPLAESPALSSECSRPEPTAASALVSCNDNTDGSKLEQGAVIEFDTIYPNNGENIGTKDKLEK